MKLIHQRLVKKVEQQAKRMIQAKRDRQNLLAQTIYLGSLGLMLVIPVIAGAYVGSWIDNMLTGYSMRWTLSLIFLGLAVGAFNVYWLIKNNE